MFVLHETAKAVKDANDPRIGVVLGVALILILLLCVGLMGKLMFDSIKEYRRCERIMKMEIKEREEHERK